MPYTPELSIKSCCTLRRIAWAAGLPMTKAINQVFELIPEVIDKKFVCAACRDNSIKYKYLKLSPEASRNLYLFFTISLHAVFLALARI